MINSDYINRVELQGRVEYLNTKTFSSGKERASFSLVISKVYNEKSYSSRFNCVYWGAVQLRNDDFIRVVGELRNESWDGKDGEKKWKTVISVIKAYSIFPVTMDVERIENEEDTTNGVVHPMTQNAQTLVSESSSYETEDGIF